MYIEQWFLVFSLHHCIFSGLLYLFMFWGIRFCMYINIHSIYIHIYIYSVNVIWRVNSDFKNACRVSSHTHSIFPCDCVVVFSAQLCRFCVSASALAHFVGVFFPFFTGCIIPNLPPCFSSIIHLLRFFFRFCTLFKCCYKTNEYSIFNPPFLSVFS